MLHLLGFDHEKLSFPFQGVGQRLTNITKPGTKVVKAVIA
jgi:ssRNA-specific RNase YbeY (16S rRNA maturation enzyme)